MSQKKVTYEVTIRAIIEARTMVEAKEEVHKRLRDMWESLPWPGKWVGYLVDEKVRKTEP